MRRQVLSRVWAAVGARSLRGAGGPGSAPARSRGTVQSFCPAGDSHRFLSRKPRGGHWQEHQASRVLAHTTRRFLRAAPRAGSAARRRHTHRPCTRRACPRGRGRLRAGPAHCKVKHAAGVWLLKMFDVDPSYFQGMKVVPVSRGLGHSPGPGPSHWPFYVGRGKKLQMAVASWILLVNLPRADLLGFLAVFWNRSWRDEGTGGPPRRPSGQRSALPRQVSPGPSPPRPPGPICSLPGGVGLEEQGSWQGGRVSSGRGAPRQACWPRCSDTPELS